MGIVLNLIATVLIVPCIILVLVFSYTKKIIQEKSFQPIKIYKKRKIETNKVIQRFNKSLSVMDQLMDRFF